MALPARNVNTRKLCCRHYDRFPATHISNCRRGLRHICAVEQRAPILNQTSSCIELSDSESLRTSENGIDASRVLFDRRHITAWSPELALYAPFGVALGAFRSLLWILGIYLDQPWFRNPSVVEAYLRLLGVTVTWKHPERIPAGRHVMVSNHCSVGDLMILFSHPTRPQRYTHLVTSALPSRVTQSRNLPVLLRPASPAVYDELALSSQASPVHLFPEGGMTNGCGMLRFSRGFTRIMQRGSHQQQVQAPPPLEVEQILSPQGQIRHPKQQQHAASHVQLQHSNRTSTAPDSDSSSEDGSMFSSAMTPDSLPVVPVALRVRTPLRGVSSHTLTSPFLANLFWFSFSPATTLEATVLPAMLPLQGEARGAFVNRVQAVIAKELGVEVRDMTIQQKRALVKSAEAAAKRRA